MTALSDALEAIVARFESAGVPAVTDARNLNPPGVVVALPTLRPRFGKASCDVDATAYVVVVNAGHPGSLAELSEYVGRVLESGIYAFTRAEPYDLTLPGGGDASPAYRLEWSITIPMERQAP